jgi:hypothetical protein
MKTIKIIGLIVSVFAIIYLAFLFFLFNYVDLNKYSPQITKVISQNTGIKIEVQGLKIKPSWDFSVFALADKTDLKYPEGEKFAQINDLSMNIALLPLLKKEIKINKISADKLMANIKDAKSNEERMYRGIEVLQNKNAIHPYIQPSILLKTHPFTFSAISVNHYRLSFIDNRNNYTIKGSDLNISDFSPNEKIKLNAKGNLILNNRKQISYNIVINSSVFPKNNAKNNKLMKIFEDLYKYNVHADINTNLNIKKDNIEGKIDIDKISFNFNNIVYPKSSLKLDFAGSKAKINASLHTKENSKILITGFFKPDKNKSIDLHVNSDKVNIKDIILIAKTMSGSFGIKNLKDIDANGFLKANFNIKSDFKKIKSSGYLKINNASITNKKMHADKINANIDFSNDSVQINQASADVNNEPVIIQGIIDKNAVADISVLANKLSLKKVLSNLEQPKMLNGNEILSGNINVKCLLKGRLDKVEPKINILATNINLKNKYLKISLPKANLALNKNDLTIEETSLYLDNVKTILSGKISNINSNPNLNPLKIDIPNQISVPVKGYSGSKIVLKGNVILTGNLNTPKILGKFDVPLINIPSSLVSVQNTVLNIDNGIKLTSSKLKIGSIIANNITSDATIGNNKLYLNNLLADAYFGKVGGNISYDFSSKKTKLDLQGRGLSANPAILGLTEKNYDINGQLDFDSNVLLSGNSKNDRLKNLKGYTDFIISDGKMGVLGKFEHLLYAQNILSNSIFRATLNVVAKAIMVKNTGVYSYMKGKITFSNGFANIGWIKTSGPSMSLYITGRCYILENFANLVILGRISEDVVRILGPIGEFSMDKAISSIPKMGEITRLFANQFTTNPDYENISQIPYLTPKTEFQTKEFKVIIDGDIQKQSSVKSFKWIAKPKIIQPASQENIQPSSTPAPAVPDFVKNLPDFKN